MSDNTIPLLLLCASGLLTALYLIRVERSLKRVETKETPELPALAPALMDLQERITLEAEETRRQTASHAKNSQTAMKVLTGVVGEYMKSGDIRHQVWLSRIDDFQEELAGALSTEATSVVEAITATIHEDGKKTRQRTAQIKTRLTDDEKDDQKSKSQQRRIAAIKHDKRPKASK